MDELHWVVVGHRYVKELRELLERERLANHAVAALVVSAGTLTAIRDAGYTRFVVSEEYGQLDGVPVEEWLDYHGCPRVVRAPHTARGPDFQNLITEAVVRETNKQFAELKATLPTTTTVNNSTHFVGVDHALGPDKTAVTVVDAAGRIIVERPSFAEVYRELAKLMALRGTCARLHVGAVITSFDHRYVLAVGYNGNASGLPNDCDSTEPGACGCLHGEANAIINCRAGREEKKRFYLTDSPCAACAKMIVNLGGVVEVNYIREYRRKAGLDILRAAGIDAFQLKDA